MEPVALVVDKLKSFAKSTQDFADNVFHWRERSTRRKPIEILKRLQREAFSDLMKLRDRQDKVERVLALYKSAKGSPFQESTTHVRGEVDILGALLVMDNVDEQNYDAIKRTGINTGVRSSFTFETSIRQKDTLAAQFVASGKGQEDVLGGPLSLAKVSYAANVNDWFSVVAIPVGAHCRDVGIATNYPNDQKKALTNYSSLRPPVLNQHCGTAFGLMVRKSNIVASLAQFVTGLGMQPSSVGFMQCLTFGQVVCQLSRSTKLSLLGVRQVPKLSIQNINLGPLTIPVSILRHHKVRETSFEVTAPTNETEAAGNVLSGSVALTLETELDESTRIGGWLQMKQSNPRHLQWAISMSDTPEDDFGCGLSLGGLIQSPNSWDHFQVETFLNFNFSKRFSLQPALVYATDGATHFPALVLRSTWSL